MRTRFNKFAALLLPLGLLALANTASAGDYHTGATLICSDCHVMHFSQQHDYTTGGTTNFTPLGGTPQENLLRNDVNSLCLSCHDGNAGIIDVLDAGNSTDRQAGYLNQQGGAGLDPTGHTLGSTDDAPGSSPVWSNANGLSCADCHEPHGLAGGANAYRNLRIDAGNNTTEGLVTYSTGTNVLTTDVFQGAVFTYTIANVNFNEPDATGSAMGDYCKGCHTNFHGAVGGSELGTNSTADGGQFIRHPAGGVDIGGSGPSDLTRFSGLTNNVKVMSPGGTWVGNETDLTPTCISCHKAHGNGNAFGLIYMSGTGTVDEEGDDGTSVRDLCGQCHIQGG